MNKNRVLSFFKIQNSLLFPPFLPGTAGQLTFLRVRRGARPMGAAHRPARGCARIPPPHPPPPLLRNYPPAPLSEVRIGAWLGHPSSGGSSDNTQRHLQARDTLIVFKIQEFNFLYGFNDFFVLVIGCIGDKGRREHFE